MQKIIPFLWFDNQTEDAVNFYVSVFADSKIKKAARYSEESAKASGQKPGSVLTVNFEIEGVEFGAINGGPHFKINPSISFFVSYETEFEVDTLWHKLAKEGIVMMELQQYPWSDKYGWVQDKFGVSWQISLDSKKNVPQTITPSLLFVGAQHGKAEEAISFYTSIFNNSFVDGILKYNAGDGEPEGTVQHAQFSLDGNLFMAMDNSYDHKFSFNEAVSFVVDCNSQEEVDYYWDKLSLGDNAQAQQCGWLKDKFGVSWQIVPRILIELMNDPDAQKSSRVVNSMLQMKKIIIDDLIKAYNG